jgi:hypothetical protein
VYNFDSTALLEYLAYVFLYGYVVLGFFYFAYKIYNYYRLNVLENIESNIPAIQNPDLSLKLDKIFEEYKINQIEQI